MNHEKEVMLEKFRGAYLAGDMAAGEKIILEFDRLIRRAVREYFHDALDLQIGYEIDDIFQLARLQILKELKHFDREKCSWTYYVIRKSKWVCQRFVRFSKSKCRDYEKEDTLSEDYLLLIEDFRSPSPVELAIEKEVMGKIDKAVKNLSPTCQAIYQVMIDGRESPYNSTHPKYRENRANIALPVRKIRGVVKGIMDSYFHS